MLSLTVCPSLCFETARGLNTRLAQLRLALYCNLTSKNQVLFLFSAYGEELSSSVLSWCVTYTETVGLIRDGERMGQEMRANAHLPVHTSHDDDDDNDDDDDDDDDDVELNVLG